MRGQAVEEHGVFGRVHKLFVDLIWSENFDSGRPLVFLAHRSPDVGVDGGGAVEGGDVVGDQHLARTRPDFARALEDLVRRFVARRGDHSEPETKQGCGFDEGGGDVIAVADINDALVAERAGRLLEGHEVRQDLTGMRAIGEAVDDRYLGVGRELDQVRVAAHAGDDPVDVAVQDTGRVVDRFAPTELDVLLAQGRGRPAHRPALMAWARASTERSSAGSRSATSRKSLPRRLATAGIMMPRRIVVASISGVWSARRRRSG